MTDKKNEKVEQEVLKVAETPVQSKKEVSKKQEKKTYESLDTSKIEESEKKPEEKVVETKKEVLEANPQSEETVNEKGNTTETKKEKGCCLFWVYGRFLIISIVKAKPIAIATIIPATAGTKYMSAADCRFRASVGTGVGAAKSTANADTACDGQ